MLVSVVVTVLNEQDAIEGLLWTLISQSRKPLEVILVDGGSKDDTRKKTQRFAKKHSKIRLFVREGANRSQGRNFGIKKASGEIIATTDAGCMPKKDWLEELIAPFQDASVDVVGGYYKPSGDSAFQKSLAVYTCVLAHQLNPKKFLPASRSLAFRKRAWKKVKGFPENLDTCEDRVFVSKLKEEGMKFTFVKEAVVLWEQEDSFVPAFKKLHGYAKGDVEAGYAPHLMKITLVWLRYLIGLYLLLQLPLVLLFLIPQYLAWVIGKGYAYVKRKNALFLLPALQLTADAAVLSGSAAGYISRRRK